MVPASFMRVTMTGGSMMTKYGSGCDTMMLNAAYMRILPYSSSREDAL